MSHPLSVRDVALLLSIEPADIEVLCTAADLPHERDEAGTRFYLPEVERWRRTVEPRDTIFMSVDDRARALVEQLGRRGVRVRVLPCELCKTCPATLPDGEAGPFVGSQTCHLCGRAICIPHGLHMLRNGKHAALRPDAACDTCFARFHPPTW